MSLQASHYLELDAERIERVDDNTFWCYVYRITFLAFEVCAVLLVRVEEQSCGCCIKFLSCKLDCWPIAVVQNDKFDGVSNLLHSGFRESLDVERQGRSPIGWDLQRNLPLSPSPERDQEQLNEVQHVLLVDLHWYYHLLQYHPRYLFCIRICTILVGPVTVFIVLNLREMINDLRADVAKLQHGMNHTQRMLEACMDMQLELQFSVRQEVSTALNRSAGEQYRVCRDFGGWVKMGHVRKGTCCICCDNHIDSLLYRLTQAFPVKRIREML